MLLSLPTFPGEKDFWSGLNSSIAAFDTAVAGALAQFDAGAVQASRAGLSRVAEAADEVMNAAARTIEFHAQIGRELALRIMTYPAPAAGTAPVERTPGGDFAWLTQAYTARLCNKCHAKD